MDQYVCQGELSAILYNNSNNNNNNNNSNFRSHRLDLFLASSQSVPGGSNSFDWANVETSIPDTPDRPYVTSSPASARTPRLTG